MYYKHQIYSMWPLKKTPRDVVVAPRRFAPWRHCLSDGFDDDVALCPRGTRPSTSTTRSKNIFSPSRARARPCVHRASVGGAMTTPRWLEG